MDFTSLICVHKIGHGLDLWVVLVSIFKHDQRGYKVVSIFYSRFGLLTVEWIDLAACQHVCKNQVLENLYSLRRPGFVIVLEGVEEVFTCSVPWTLQSC